MLVYLGPTMHSEHAAGKARLRLAPRLPVDSARRCRYSVEELLDLSCRYGELRSLQRTLAAGGERGREALAEICGRLSQSPGQRATGGHAGAVRGLPVQDRLQFVQRCHLAMRRPELAGTA